MRFLFFLILSVKLMAFDQVVIWGHKLNPYSQIVHTHSYIHYGFYRAFQSLGYDTYWFEDTPPPQTFDFSNSLFITEGASKHIPVNTSSIYCSHQIAEPLKNPILDRKRVIGLGVTKINPNKSTKDIEVEPFTYFNFVNNTVTILWATDLLPHEIDKMKEKLTSQKRKKQVAYIGTLNTSADCKNDDVIYPFVNAAKKAGYTFFHTHPSKKPISPEENRKVVFESLLAPAIQGKLQLEHGYLPCRIFKNISYGALGITNNHLVYELLGDRVVYNKDTEMLFYDAVKRLETWTIEDQKEAMDYVKNNHTYINRVKTILQFIDALGIE